MIKGLFQVVKNDKSRGMPQYGHVYVVLKDGTHSSRPIFENVLRTKAENLFDILEDYHVGDFNMSKSRWPGSADLVKNELMIFKETEEHTIMATEK